jgi:hypothetical protein
MALNAGGKAGVVQILNIWMQWALDCSMECHYFAHKCVDHSKGRKSFSTVLLQAMSFAHCQTEIRRLVEQDTWVAPFWSLKQNRSLCLPLFDCDVIRFFLMLPILE